MAILQVFALHDSKAGFFNVPFFMPSIGQAVRSVSDLCADPQSIISRHPGDFSLFHLGHWHDDTATFVPNVPPIHLGGGEQFAPQVRGGAPFAPPKFNSDLVEPFDMDRETR